VHRQLTAPTTSDPCNRKMASRRRPTGKCRPNRLPRNRGFAPSSLSYQTGNGSNTDKIFPLPSPRRAVGRPVVAAEVFVPVWRSAAGCPRIRPFAPRLLQVSPSVGARAVAFPAVNIGGRSLGCRRRAATRALDPHHKARDPVIIVLIRGRAGATSGWGRGYPAVPRPRPQPLQRPAPVGPPTGGRAHHCMRRGILGPCLRR